MFWGVRLAFQSYLASSDTAKDYAFFAFFPGCRVADLGFLFRFFGNQGSGGFGRLFIHHVLLVRFAGDNIVPTPLHVHLRHRRYCVSP